MKSEDDPEARVRELEEPLAETARASEAAANRPPSKWAPPSGQPVQPSPSLPYGGSPASPPTGAGPQSLIRWIMVAAFVVGMIALPIVIFSIAGHQISRSGVSALNPAPSTAATRAPGAGQSMTAATPAPAGANLSIAGINESRTVVCKDGKVNVSGVGNEVVIAGHCTLLDVSGVRNKVTVDAADTIQASGFDNQIFYLTGTPQIQQSGQGNVVQKH
jgi:hypothetical protein